LSRADLSRADLSGANLYGADLYRADLSRADLSRADLSRAYLSRADLCGSDLTRANLYGSDLSFTCIFGFYLGKYFGFAWKKEKEIIIKIGCIEYSLEHWLENYRIIGEKNHHSEKEINTYRNMLEFIKTNF
jgi:hypothetical protein